MFDFVIKPINKIIDAVQFIICLIEYIGDVFKWMGVTVTVIIQIILSGRLCFVFYLFHAFWEFFLFVIFEIILILLFLPSKVIGKFLGYPIIIPNNNKNLRKFKNKIGTRNIYKSISPEIDTKCYGFKRIPPFPKWELKIPNF